MKKIFILCVPIILFWFVSATTTKLDSVVNWHNYSVLKVVLDGKSRIVTPVVANWQSPQSLKTLMDKVGWTHAINWGFFCPSDYEWCNWGSTDSLRIFEWTLFSKRGEDINEQKSVFWFDIEWKPMPLATKDWSERIGWWRKNKWLIGMQNGISMQTLVKEWVDVAVLNYQMNNDPKQSKAANKTFICNTIDNSTIYMWYVDNITFSDLAGYIINTFSCYNAILLDNWRTKAMIYNNSYVAWPWRSMMDAYVIIEWWNVWANIEQIADNYVVDENIEKLENAITWMYNAGLTIYNNKEDFLPNNYMTREEASKFFSVFAKEEFSLQEDPNKVCNFLDISLADPTLTSSIKSSCKMGIFKWYNNRFMYSNKLTNAQAVTVLMRIVFGWMYEPDSAYYINYLNKAKEIWVVWNIDINSNITRWEAAIMLYDTVIYKKVDATWSDTDMDTDMDTYIDMDMDMDMDTIDDSPTICEEPINVFNCAFETDECPPECIKWVNNESTSEYINYEQNNNMNNCLDDIVQLDCVL